MDYAEIGRQFGLNEAQTRAAFEQLAPVVAAGIRRNNQTDDGLGNLLKALQAGNHSRYTDDPSSLQFDRVADDGNAVAEQTETNNTRFLSIKVGADLLPG